MTDPDNCLLCKGVGTLPGYPDENPPAGEIVCYECDGTGKCYRRYTTAELREAAKDPDARFVDRKGRVWRYMACCNQWESPQWRFTQYHSELSRRLLRRLA